MDALEDHARGFIERALSGISRDEAADTYVVSLFVYGAEDDLLQPTATVGFDTESEVATSAPASDEAEARWISPSWLLWPPIVLPYELHDVQGRHAAA